MKKQFLNSALVALAIVTLPTASIAAYIQDITGWYVAATGAVGWHNDIMFKEEGTGYTNLDYKTGGGGSAALGLIIDETWRFEFEAAFRRSNLDRATVSVAGTTVNRKGVGHVHDVIFMLNSFYDFYILQHLAIYLGGGVGASFNERKSTVVLAGIPTTTENTDTLFAFQLMPGISFSITDNVALTAGYRLFGSSKPKRTKASVDLPIIHSVEGGIRLSF